MVRIPPFPNFEWGGGSCSIHGGCIIVFFLHFLYIFCSSFSLVRSGTGTPEFRIFLISSFSARVLTEKREGSPTEGELGNPWSSSPHPSHLVLILLHAKISPRDLPSFFDIKDGGRFLSGFALLVFSRLAFSHLTEDLAREGIPILPLCDCNLDPILQVNTASDELWWAVNLTRSERPS